MKVRYWTVCCRLYNYSGHVRGYSILQRIKTPQDVPNSEHASDYGILIAMKLEVLLHARHIGIG